MESLQWPQRRNVTSNHARVNVATVGSPTACVLECLAAPVAEQTVNKLILLSCNVEVIVEAERHPCAVKTL